MNSIIKFSAIFMLLLILPGLITWGKTASLQFDKASFYAAIASGAMDEVNSVLAQLKESTFPEKSAYEGALLMKKAGLVTKAKEKLSLFKSGRIKLEEALKRNDENIEYHFLRLIIQENSPKIVKYKSDLKTDAALVRTSFKKLSLVVQQAVKEYSKKSTYLKGLDL